jgi:WD40 repeat protein
VPFHPEGFGMVGFAEMSRSEKTIMTYQLSGRINYWDIETGRQTLDLPSVPYLSRIRISRDRRFMVGSTGGELVLVDTVTGAVRSRTSLMGAISFDISPDGDEIACASGAEGRLDRWSLTGDTLVPLPGLPPLPAAPSLLCYGADTLFVADSAGGLHSVSRDGADSELARNVLARSDAIDAAPGLIAVGAPDWIRIFSTDLLDGVQAPTYIRSLLAHNPFHAPAGLAFLPTEQLLAWRADKAPPELALLGIAGVDKPEAQGSFQGLPTGFLAPLSALRVSPDSFLGVESDGTVRLTEPATGISRFDQRLPGVFAAVADAPTELIAGRNSAAAPGGSLLRVNTRTRETVAIKDRNLFTYTLLLDETGGNGKPVLYSVGIDASGATNLVQHSGPGFEQETLLGRVSEEDLDVSLAVDPSTHVLYATLGHDSISAWDGAHMREIAPQNTAPRRLVARAGMLFSLNRDSTVSVLNATTGERLAEISLFADGEWCALFNDGRYAASLGGDVHVKVFQNDSPVQTTEDYRLRTGH